MRRIVVSGVAIAAVTSAIALAGSGSSTPPPPGSTGEPDPPTRAAPTQTRFGGAREDCSTRSEAEFPGGFTSRRNLVVGPLSLIGGAFTDPGTVREFGGNKFPLLVKAGHTVTIRLPKQARRSAGLGYGPVAQGKNTLRDTYRTVTFVACRPGKPPPRYSPHGPSGSYADETAVTFWSGFILTDRPACIPLDVYVDGATAARRIGLSLGRRCGR